MLCVDSSSLILLAKIGILDKAIASIKEKPTITEAVYQESTFREELFDARMIKSRVEEKHIDKIKVKNTGLCQKIRKDFDLGEGEAEAIVLCVENKADLITDDKKAINACRILNVRFTTTGMLLCKLYERGRITKSEAKIYVKKLETFGRYSKNALQKIREGLEK